MQIKLAQMFLITAPKALVCRLHLSATHRHQASAKRRSIAIRAPKVWEGIISLVPMGPFVLQSWLRPLNGLTNPISAPQRFYRANRAAIFSQRTTTQINDHALPSTKIGNAHMSLVVSFSSTSQTAAA
jgi:hypothetical protein